ncbi:MAG TPA: hypothetical protein VK911_05370 [Vicinamibacterales bacterium]|nr:hypothetical protein [Vicinamibacterales bacterium]
MDTPATGRYHAAMVRHEAGKTGGPIDRLRDDRTSGASELMAVALEALKRAREEGPDALAAAAAAVCEAQPSMASLRNLAAAAARDPHDPGALDRFEQRWRRAGPALVRVATGILLPGEPRPARLVTCSFSGSVLACVQALARRTRVEIACGEGRPALEGRRMAAALAAAGARVEFFTDAALGQALDGADALVVGADAVTPAWFLNKCGTAALADAALRAGVPVYVLATRDKFLHAAAVVDRPPGRHAGRTTLGEDSRSPGLRVDEHDPGEVWDAPPAGVTIRNPYFERVPMDLVTGVITDAGLLGTGMLEEAL